MKDGKQRSALLAAARGINVFILSRLPLWYNDNVKTCSKILKIAFPA